MPDSEPFKTPKKTPVIMSGLRLRMTTPFGHLHMTIVIDMKTDREQEVFAQIGKCGEMVNADTEGVCRLASLYLRAGGRVEDVIKQLRGIGTHLATDKQVISVPDSLGKALATYLRYKKQYGTKALILGDVVIDEEAVEAVRQELDEETTDIAAPPPPERTP